MSAGAELPARVVQPTEIQLFRFSAATRNPHRIHYDSPYAQVEGYPGVLVQSHLFASYLVHYLQDAFGAGGRLSRFSWRNRAIATPQDRLVLGGTVASLVKGGESETYEVDLVVHNQKGAACVTGSATIVVFSPVIAGE